MAKTKKFLDIVGAMPTGMGYQVSYGYKEVDIETGEIVNAGEKGSFLCLDNELEEHIKFILDYVRKNKLEEN